MGVRERSFSPKLGPSRTEEKRVFAYPATEHRVDVFAFHLPLAVCSVQFRRSRCPHPTPRGISAAQTHAHTDATRIRKTENRHGHAGAARGRRNFEERGESAGCGALELEDGMEWNTGSLNVFNLG